MWTDHDQLKISPDKAIGKQVLRCMNFELVHEDAFEISPLLLSHRGILQNLADLPVEGPLVLLIKPPNSLLEGGRL